MYSFGRITNECVRSVDKKHNIPTGKSRSVYPLQIFISINPQHTTKQAGYSKSLAIPNELTGHRREAFEASSISEQHFNESLIPISETNNSHSRAVCRIINAVVLKPWIQ
jgi:hypothetical protein